MTTLNKATEALRDNTLVIIRKENIVKYREHGIGSLLSVLANTPELLCEASLADKVVGKAAALLMAKGGVKEVYAEVVSEGAIEVFRKFRIAIVYGQITKHIVNRSGTGICPMEKTVENIDEPDIAFTALQRTHLLLIKQEAQIMKKLGFGCMRLPIKNGNYADVDIERFKKMIDDFLAKGFTYFDTAYVYHSGKSEVALKKALVERYPRDKFTITTKMPMFLVNTAADLERIFNEQLARLGVDFIDYYWLHALNSAQYAKSQKLDAFGFIAEKKRQGLIRHIGFSYHDDAKLLDRILTEHPEVEYVQLQINYVDWESPSVEARKCYEVATKHNVPVIVMEPLKGGALVNVPKEVEKAYKEFNPDISVASWGIRYAASLDNVLTVLSGMSDEKQVADNISYMADFVPLSDREKQIVDMAAAIINDGTAVPCTACRYCVDGCPKKIAIPEYFALLNENKRMNGYSNGGVYYNNLLLEGHGKASDCVKCGKCEKVCPQHLPIRNFLKDVTKTFE